MIRSLVAFFVAGTVLVEGTRKLDMVHYAHRLNDLQSPPANRLEALKRDLKGFHSIRINDQRRIVFRWTDDGPESVAVVDFHS